MNFSSHSALDSSENSLHSSTTNATSMIATEELTELRSELSELRSEVVRLRAQLVLAESTAALAASSSGKKKPSRDGDALASLSTYPTEDEEFDDDLEQARPLARGRERNGNGDYSHVDTSENEESGDDPDGLFIRPDCPHEHASFLEIIVDRAGWLVGLLVLQSLSSFIIMRNESLLQSHAVIVQFLTMLVGAGGNAGNQASVFVIRGLALRRIRRSNLFRFLQKEFILGIMIAGILGLAGYLRAYLFAVPLKETMAITVSLVAIVWISTIIGNFLPLLMKFVGIDPAHSSTTIQVVMDIVGVTLTCRE